MTLTLLAALCLQSQRPITFDSLALRVPVVLEQLSAHVGQNLECDASFTNEVVLVHVKGVEPTELLERFAFANVALWRKERDRLVLVPDAKRRTEQEKEFAAKRLKNIQRVLDKLKGELALPLTLERATSNVTYLRNDKYTTAENYYRGLQIQRDSPLSRLAMRALIELGAERLAAIQGGKRLVLSSNPTPMQTAWPRAILLLDDFAKEWALHDQALGVIPGEDRMEAWGYEFGNLPRGNHSVFSRTAPNKVRLSIADILNFGARGVYVTAMNTETGVYVGKSLNLQMASDATVASPPSNHPKQPFTLREISRHMGALSKSLYQQERKISPEIRAYLSDPVQNEPLALGSEVYSQYADVRGRNLIAVVNDNSFQRFLLPEASTLNANEFERLSKVPMVFSETDNWIVMTPSSPVEARRNRDSRTSCKELINSATRDGETALKALSGYLLQRPYGAAYGIGGVISLALQGTGDGAAFNDAADIYRLYGSLSEAQRRSLKSGQYLTYSNLSSLPKTILDRMIFGQQFYSDEFVMAVALEGAPDEIHSRGNDEPTEQLPNGIPALAALTLSSKSLMDITLHDSKSTMRWFGDTGIKTLAMHEFYAKHPELIEGNPLDWSHPDRYVPIERHDSALRLSLPNNLVWRGKLRVIRVLSGRVKRDELPKAHQDAVALEVKRMEDSLKAGNTMKMIISPRNQQRGNPPPR
ncbi:MAG: hypothetical protein ABL962_00225 [Fimbriimonadaceae bacterium]